MAKKVVHSFGSGQVDPRMAGRSDFIKYFNSCLIAQNYLLNALGNIEFIAGTRYIGNTKNNSVARIINFIYSVDIAYMLEFGENYIRFFRSKQALGAPYEIVSPYLAANLDDIQHAQSADVKYLVDGLNKPKQLVRNGDTDWELNDVPFKNGPFLDVNLEESITIAPSYPAWATATPYLVGDIVAISGTAINPPAADTLDNTAVNNDGGGLVTIAITGHPYVSGQSVTIAGTTNYNGTFVLQSGTVAAVSVQILATYVAETPAGTETINAAVADKGAGLVGIPTTTNTFSTGDLVTLAGFSAAAYSGTFEVHNSSTSSEVVILAAFTAEALTASETITPTNFYKCLIAHTSGGGNPTPPGNTTDWTAALTFTGTNLTLTLSGGSSSTFEFKSGHVGALFKITHPRSDSGISGAFTSINASEWVRVSKNVSWSATTSGTWGGVFEVQKSYDDGSTHEFVKLFRSEGGSNARNIPISGEESEDGALYRIALTSYFSGTFNYDFNIDEFTTDGIVEITSYTSASVVGATVLTPMGKVIQTNDWTEGAWSDYRGWPRTVAFFAERLVFAGNDHLETTIWFSKTDDFHNFKAGTLDDDAIIKRLDGDQINRIQWLASADFLIVGTAGSPWKIGPGDPERVLSPTNITARNQNNEGVSSIVPVKINNALVYPNLKNKKLIELLFDDSIQGFSGKNLNRISRNLFEMATITDVISSTEPEKRLYVLRSDGVLLTLTYIREEEFLGWTELNTNGFIESLEQIPGDAEDEIWTITKRTISGVTNRFIEVKEPQGFDLTDTRKAWFLHAALDLDLGASFSITGITNASPGVVTSVGHPLVTGDLIHIYGVTGMEEANGDFEVTVIDADTFSLKDIDTGVVIDSTSWGVYLTDGTAKKVRKIFPLAHLDGSTVSAIADGTVVSGLTVSGGQVNIGVYSNYTIIGIPYFALLQPMDPDFEGGLLSGNRKNINRMVVKLFRTGSLQIGSKQDELQEVTLKDQTTILNSAIELFSDDYVYEFDGDWSRSTPIYLGQNKPFPQTIISLIYEIEGKGL